MMTSRQVIHSAIVFTGPDRLPLMFDAFGVSDVHHVGWNKIGEMTLYLCRESVNLGPVHWYRSYSQQIGQYRGFQVAGAQQYAVT